MRKQADIAQNVKDFLKSRTVQGAALGGAAGTGLGLLNTKADLEHLMPYIASGTVGGGLLGSAVDGGPSKPSDLQTPSRIGQLLSTGAGATIAAILAAVATGKATKGLGYADDVVRRNVRRAAVSGGIGGGVAGGTLPYWDDIDDLGYYFEE